MSEQRKAAVIDGVLQYLSVSSITKFDPLSFGGCERKWFYRYVKRLPEPDEQQHITGRDMHGEIDVYLRTGDDVLGPLARSGKHLMPEPGADLLVEADIGVGLDVDGVPVVGRLDCAHERGFYLDTEGELRPDPPGTIEVIDWKSTSDLKYAKTGAELINLVQMSGYAEWARRRSPGLEHFRLSHVYFQKRGKPKALKATALFPLAKVRERWQSVEATVKRMRVVALAQDPEEVPANYASCSAYKGCAYRSICPMSREHKLVEIFGGRSMDLLSRLKAQTQPQAASPIPTAGAQPPATPNPAPTPSTTPSLTSLLGLARSSQEKTESIIAARQPATVAALQAQEKSIASAEPAVVCVCGDSFMPAFYDAHKAACAKAKAIDAFGGPVYGPCPACGVPVDGNNGSRTPSGRIVHTNGCKAASPIVPADAARSEGAASAMPIEPATVLPPVIAQAAQDLGAVAVDDAPQKARTRGRPKKSPEAPAPTMPIDASHAAALNDMPRALLVNDPQSEGAKRARSAFDQGLVLIVDARVEGLDAMPLDAYIAKVCAVLSTEYKAADLRCAPKDSPLAYGGWKGALAALVAAEPPAPGVYTLADVRESEVRQVVVEALKPLCSTFIRGF